MLDMKALAQATAEIVKEATAPLIKRIEELEGRAAQPGRDGVDGKDGADGAAGKDCDMDVVMARIDEHLASLPLPENGKDGRDGADGADGIDGSKGKDGESGRDGADVVDALIDRDGALVLTLSDGRVKSLGSVVGKDGRDGADGQMGAPGFELTDFDTDWRPEEKVLVLSWVSGETKTSHELFVPYLRDEGVWSDGKTYRKGDCVTWAGSLWTAQDDTAEKPETGKAWRLAVKRGRDGRSAVGA